MTREDKAVMQKLIENIEKQGYTDVKIINETQVIGNGTNIKFDSPEQGAKFRNFLKKNNIPFAPITDARYTSGINVPRLVEWVVRYVLSEK